MSPLSVSPLPFPLFPRSFPSLSFHSPISSLPLPPFSVPPLVSLLPLHLSIFFFTSLLSLPSSHIPASRLSSLPTFPPCSSYPRPSPPSHFSFSSPVHYSPPLFITIPSDIFPLPSPLPFSFPFLIIVIPSLLPSSTLIFISPFGLSFFYCYSFPFLLFPFPIPRLPRSFFFPSSSSRFPLSSSSIFRSSFVSPFLRLCFSVAPLSSHSLSTSESRLLFSFIDTPDADANQIVHGKQTLPILMY